MKGQVFNFIIVLMVSDGHRDPDPGPEWDFLGYEERVDAATLSGQKVPDPLDDFLIWANRRAQFEGVPVNLIFAKNHRNNLNGLIRLREFDSSMTSLGQAAHDGDAKTLAKYLTYGSVKYDSVTVKSKAAEALGELKDKITAYPYIDLLASFAFNDIMSKQEQSQQEPIEPLEQIQQEQIPTEVSLSAAGALGDIGGPAWDKYKGEIIEFLNSPSINTADRKRDPERVNNAHEAHCEYMARIRLLKLVGARGSKTDPSITELFLNVLHAHDSSEAFYVALALSYWPSESTAKFVEELVGLVSLRTADPLSRFGAAIALNSHAKLIAPHREVLQRALTEVRGKVKEARVPLDKALDTKKQADDDVADADRAYAEAEEKRKAAIGAYRNAVLANMQKAEKVDTSKLEETSGDAKGHSKQKSLARERPLQRLEEATEALKQVESNIQDYENIEHELDSSLKPEERVMEAEKQKLQLGKHDAQYEELMRQLGLLGAIPMTELIGTAIEAASTDREDKSVTLVKNDNVEDYGNVEEET